MTVPIITVFVLFILTFGYTTSKVEARKYPMGAEQYYQNSDALRFYTKGRQCRPGEVIRIDCHTCTCTRTGAMKCTEDLCLRKPSKSKSIEGKGKRKLAANCKTGEVLDLDCNRCLCIRRGKLECTENKCPGKDKFSVAEQNKLLNKIGKICNVGDVIETNCKSCTCLSPGKLKCTNAKRKCKTKPGLTINMKKVDTEHQSQLLLKGSIEDLDGKIDDEKEIMTQNQEKDQDQYVGPSEDQDFPDNGGKYTDKHRTVLNSLMEIQKLAKNCRRTEVIETISHLCKCISVGVVDCKIKKGYEDFENFSFSMSGKPKKIS